MKSEIDPGDIAERYFLRDDHVYGCAETAYIVLKTVFGLPRPEDSASAMVLNGGVAYTGGICGALTGAAMAVGEYAEICLGNHHTAKRAARNIIIEVIGKFLREFSSTDCRVLTGYNFNLPEEHDEFISSGIWRTACMDQIRFTVRQLRNPDFSFLSEQA